MNKLEAFLVKFDDSLNPILIRELRQIVRGKLIWIVMTLSLCVQAAFLCLVFNNDKFLNTVNGGKEVFNFMYQALFFITMFFIPLYHSSRLSNDIAAKADELVYITTVSPYEIIKGRFYACMTFVIMVYAISSPFLCLLLCLPQFNISYCFVSIIFGIILSGLSMAFLLNIAVEIKGKNAPKHFSFFAFVIQLFLFGSANATILAFNNREFFYSMRESEAYVLFAAFVFILTVTYLLLQFAVCNSIEHNEKYIFFLRKRITICWFVLLALFYRSYEMLTVWGIIFTIVIIVQMGMGISETEEYSKNVMEKTKGGFLKKLIYFPFSCGFSNSYAWCLLMALLTDLAMEIRISMLPSATSFHRGYMSGEVSLPCLYAFVVISFYCMLGKLLKRYIFKDIEPKYTWGIAMACFTIYTVLHSLARSIFGFDEFLLKIFNPIFIFENCLHNKSNTITMLPIVFCIAVALNCSILYKQTKKYFLGNINEL